MLGNYIAGKDNEKEESSSESMTNNPYYVMETHAFGLAALMIVNTIKKRDDIYVHHPNYRVMSHWDILDLLLR